MFQFAGIKDFDWTMFFVVMIICALGVLQIFSATHDTIWQGSWWKQMIYIAAGVVLMWIATSIDYHALMSHVYPLYIASIVLLIAVLAIGKRAFGSTRWIALPAGIHLQVSEFAKIVIILLVARFLTELNKDVLELRDLLKLAGVILLPMALIAKEPDLGTALTYLPILAIGIFLAGMPLEVLDGDRSGGSGGFADRLRVAAGLSESAYRQFPRSRAGSAGDGVSADSVENRGGGWRNMGQRRYQGKPDAIALPPGSAY